MARVKDSIRLGIVTGLQKEAACVQARARALPKGARPMVFSAAGQADVARNAARHMIAQGAAGLISFGIAGGLDPSLGPGVVVIADRVVLPDGTSLACHDPWVDRLLKADGGFDSGAILGSDHAVMTAREKAALFRNHGALAVDMESHAVARVAADAGVPFIAVRAVGDPAHRPVPRAALAGLTSDGRTRALPVMLRLLRRPRDLPGLLRLARDTKAAIAALKRTARLNLPDLLDFDA